MFLLLLFLSLTKWYLIGKSLYSIRTYLSTISCSYELKLSIDSKIGLSSKRLRLSSFKFLCETSLSILSENSETIALNLHFQY